MMRLALGVLGLLAGPVLAERSGAVLAGDEISATLTGARLTYAGGAWQEFLPSGRTLYNAGSDSWGYWEVSGDHYCSQWPPADGWACYEVSRGADGEIGFRGESGHVTWGVIEK